MARDQRSIFATEPYRPPRPRCVRLGAGRWVGVACGAIDREALRLWRCRAGQRRRGRLVAGNTEKL